MNDKHLHTFTRLKPPPKKGQLGRYKCTHPTCTSVYTSDLLLGKEALCSKCGDTKIIITAKMLKNANFLCHFCGNTMEDRKWRTNNAKTKDFLKEIFEIEEKIL